MEKKVSKIEKVRSIYTKISIMVFLLLINTKKVYAVEYVNNAKNSILDDILAPIAIVITLGVTLFCFVKKNYVAMVITIACGGFVTYLIANPKAINDIGDTFAKMIGLK